MFLYPPTLKVRILIPQPPHSIDTPFNFIYNLSLAYLDKGDVLCISQILEFPEMGLDH